MYTIILCSLIGLIIGFVGTYYDGWGAELIEYILSSVFGAIIGAIVGVAVATALPASLTTKTYKKNIVTLQDGNSISGHFFLGSGNIEGKMKYVFYYETNGGYRMMQLDYEDVTIKYTIETPRLITHKRQATSAMINKWAFDIEEGRESYVIEVPKGTIQSNYTLDAK